jgi:hypothetical protein
VPRVSALHRATRPREPRGVDTHYPQCLGAEMIDNFWTNLATLIVLGVANGFVSLTVTKSLFFQSFRDFFFNHSIGPRGQRRRFIPWIHDLVSCPYCFSHWVSLAMVIIWKPILTKTEIGTPYLDFLVSLFALVGVSSISWALFLRLSPDD